MLILDDTDRSKPLTTGFYGRYLMTAMNSCHAKRKILILDCCNAGTFTTLIGLKASEEPPITELGINPQQFYAIMSSRHLTPSLELPKL